MRRLLVLGLLAGATAVAQSPSPAPSYRSRILGVLDGNTGEPIEGVRITAVGSGTWATTTKTGTITLAFLPDGGDSVTLRKTGYLPTGVFASISATDTAAITVIMKPVVNTLPTVTTRDSTRKYISPALSAVEERRKRGFGQFIMEEQLRKSDARDMSEVIRQLTGVRIICNVRVPRTCFATEITATNLNPGKPTQCPMVVYVDGIVSYDNNLLNLRVNEFAAVEAYVGARIPEQYNTGNAGCGVLLFWSRER